MEDIIKKRKKTKRGFMEKDWPSSFLEKVTCPLCRSRISSKLYPNNYDRIVKCNACGLIYTNPRLKKTYLKHLYSEEYFHNSNSTHFGYENYLADENKIVKTFSARVADIERYRANGRLLDIGCATGFFMKAAHDRGWKVEGVEISEFAAKYAKDHYKFKVYTKDYLTLNLKKDRYDLVTLWDVIEHFYDPVAALKKIHSILNTDGIVALSTPDVGSIPSMLTKQKWVGYKLSDEHLTYFSFETLTKLLEKAGFTVIKKTHTGKHVSLPMLADRISIYNSALGNFVKTTSALFPKDYFLYVNPFDIMSVYAKKA